MLRLSSSEKHPIPLPPGHRFPFQKYALTRQQLEYEGVISSDQVFSPEFVSDEVITMTHCADFWDRAKSLTLTAKEIRRIGFPAVPELISRSWSSASGTVRAAEYALNDGAGMNLAGGTHHAFFDRGDGFCLLNDIAIAANYLLQIGAVKKVLVIDLDVHQGDGTAALFAGREDVFTFSMHCAQNYPFRKEISHLDVELDAGTGDEGYLATLKKHVPYLLEAIQPDIVFYQAGVDVLETDKLGKLSLSPRGLFERDDWVIRNCRERNIPLVAVMGGGYSPDMNQLVRAHCTTYKLVLEHYEKFTIRLH